MRLDDKSVKCTVPLLHGAPCGMKFAYKTGGPTSTLWRHVRRHHPGQCVQLRSDQMQIDDLLKQAPLPVRTASRKDRESGERVFALWVFRNLRPFCVGEDHTCACGFFFCTEKHTCRCDDLLQRWAGHISGGRHVPPGRHAVPRLGSELGAEGRLVCRATLDSISTPVSIYLDIWTAGQRSLSAGVLYCLSPEWNLMERVWMVEDVSTLAHTSDTLRELVLRNVKEMNMTAAGLFVCCTDNGANIVAAMAGQRCVQLSSFVRAGRTTGMGL